MRIGPIEIRRLQPDDGDVERRPVLDEHAAVAIEEHAARRAEGQLALMVVLGHLAELLVLDDLEEPERAGEEQEARDGAHLQHGDAPDRNLAFFRLSDDGHGLLVQSPVDAEPLPFCA
jgi:hypothetical protein